MKYITKNNKIIKAYTQKEIDEIINNYLFSVQGTDDKNQERKRLQDFLSLKILPDNPNSDDYLKEKGKLLKYFINQAKKNFTSLDNLYFTEPANFGNRMQMINNIMYYCEILGCKNIYLNPAHNWFIKNTVIIGKFNISVIEPSKINCDNINTFCLSLWCGFCLYPLNIRPEIRINLLKNEMLKNLPKINIDPKALYIHIRAGDIFTNSINPYLSQPPLCFYQKIIKENKFSKIYLIAKTNNNPVINRLLQEFPYIFFKQNSVEVDIAYLMLAYYLVGANSSMSLAALILNDNLREYWEYDINRFSEKFGHLHFDVYEYPRKFKIYKMKPSEKYKNEMFAWRKNPQQMKLMIDEKCFNNFFVVKPNL